MVASENINYSQLSTLDGKPVTNDGGAVVASRFQSAEEHGKRMSWGCFATDRPKPERLPERRLNWRKKPTWPTG
jgi:hypothetical protein